MKSLFCGKCFSFHSFGVDDTEDQKHPWQYCDCRQMAARWKDPNFGTVEVLAQVPERAFIIGMNNNFLSWAIRGGRLSNEDWQNAHARATVAPDHVFDAHKRNCWACIIRVGETSDINWHPYQEKVRAGMTVEEALFEPVTIKVNTVAKEWARNTITYDEIVTLAGKDPSKGTLYTITCYVRGKEGFCVSPGQVAKVEAGLLINCVYTGNA